MKRIIINLSLLMIGFTITNSYAITGEEILKSMDRNLKFSTIIYTGTMEIFLDSNNSRIKTMKAYAEGDKKAYVEFLNKEDSRTKYLKIDKNLWIRDGKEANTFLISGHLLKQGIMGSDLSYEDALESESLYEKYQVVPAGEEVWDGRLCYIVDLNAKVKEAPYEKRKIWVDKERFISLKEEMYAKSGMLMKERRVTEVRQIKDRFYPVKSEIINRVRIGSKTVMTMDDIVFDQVLDPKYFTKRYLER